MLKRVELFKNGDPLFLSQVALALRPHQVAAGDTIVKIGDIGREMYLVARGEVEVLDSAGRAVKMLKAGEFFGEIAILHSTPRIATVRAKTSCDLFILDKADFQRILHDHPQFADDCVKIAKERYDVNVSAQALAARPA